MRSHERVEASSFHRNFMFGAFMSAALASNSAGVQAQTATVSGDAGSTCFGARQTMRKMTGWRRTKWLRVWVLQRAATVRRARAAWAKEQILALLQDDFLRRNF
jgi:hypothetical protein